MQPVFPWDGLTTLQGYEVVDADLTSACEIAVAVWGGSIGWPDRPVEMYRSCYLSCPVGQAELKFLRHVPSNKVVGTLGVIPRRVLWNEKEIRVGVLSHFCVIAEHRKIKPAKFLLKAVVDACRTRYDVLYGMPATPQSVAFIGKLARMTYACTVNRRVKVLRHAKYAARFLPRLLANVAGEIADTALRCRDLLGGRNVATRFKWVDGVDPRMAQLWAAFPLPGGWNAVRDVEMLRWRLDQLPSIRRRYLLVESAPSGALLAWFACDTNSFDHDILMVQDFWADGGPYEIGRAAIRTLCRAARGLGFSAVEVRLAAPKLAATPWISEGFVNRNQSPVFVVWLNGLFASNSEEFWHVTEFDNDC